MNYLKTGTLLPVFENDPNDIQIVYNALKTIDLQKKSRVGEESVIDVQDCGAAYRFLMPILATTPGKWLLRGTDRLLQRPILPLVIFLNEHGADIQKTDLGWRIEGKKLQIGDFEIDTSETSQYVSALLMIKGGKEKGEKENKNPYIKMTETIINWSCLKSQKSFDISLLSDWSAATFWLAHALLHPNAHYLLKNLHFDNLQGDANIASYFKKWGIHFSENEHGIEIKHIHNIKIPKQKIDVAQTPDVAMVLSVLSVCYPFELTMSGLKNLNLKESNRLDIMVHELSKFTVIDKHSEDAITIHKRTDELPKTFHFDSYNDHRFVMAWSLFGSFGTVDIKNPECVKKSYPDFNTLILVFMKPNLRFTKKIDE